MFEIGLTHYLTVASILFVLGVVGIFAHARNVIVILVSIELILLAVIINFVAFSRFMGDVTGQTFAMFIILIALAQIGLGMAILTAYVRNRGSIEIDNTGMMKG